MHVACNWVAARLQEQAIWESMSNFNFYSLKFYRNFRLDFSIIDDFLGPVLIKQQRFETCRGIQTYG